MLMPTFLFEHEFTQYADIIKEASAVERHFNKGSIIIHSGELRKHSYFVLEGLASFSMVRNNGQEKIATFRGKGTIFPLYYSYKTTSMEKHIVVTAYTDLKVLELNREDLYRIMLKYPSFSATMCDVYCKYANALLFDISSNDSEKSFIKLCNFMYIYVTHMDTADSVPESFEEIGDTLGLSETDIHAGICELERRHIISILDDQILITEPEQLYDICSGSVKDWVAI